MVHDLAVRRLADRLARLQGEVSSLSRARQIAHSTVPVVVAGETVDMPVVDLLGTVPRVELDLFETRAELALAAADVATVQDQVAQIEDGTLPAMQQAIDIAQATADSTVKVHFEADLGAGVKPVLNDTSDRGDLYYRLDGQVERWQNSTLGWVLVEDTVLTKAIADLRAAEDAIDDLNLVKLPALQSELDAAEVTIAQHTTDLSGLDTRLTSTANDLDAAEASLATAKTDLDAAEATIAQHAATLSDHGTRLTDAESKVTTLNNTTIPSLNADLATKLPKINAAGATKEFRDVLTFTGLNGADNICIETPITFANYMTRLTIEGYNYSAAGSDVSVVASVYTYNVADSNGPGTLINRVASSKGTARVGVRFAKTNEATPRLVVILSPANLPNAVWAYPKITVDALTSLGTAPDSFGSGWVGVNVAEADIATRYVSVLGPTTAQDLQDTNVLTQGWRTTGTTTIDGGKITADSVTAGQIAANAITATELAANAVYANAIQANAVTANAIAADAVTANKIAADAVTAREIAANSITADELAVGAITATKAVIATGAILSAQIADAAISTAKIADAAITNAKVSDLSAEKITAGTIAAARIGARTITADKIVADSLTANEIAADAITANELAVGAITASKAVIANSAIQTAQIADLAVTNAKVTGLSATKITTDTLGADRIGANTISADKLLVGDFANHFNDPQFLHPAGYSTWARVVTSGVPGIEKAGTSTQNGAYITATAFPVTPGEKLHVTATRTNVLGSAGEASIYFRPLNAAGTALAVSKVLALSVAGTPTAIYTVPASAATVTVGFYTESTMTSATKVRISDVRIRRMEAGELIVDGAVTALKIGAGAVTTAKLDAGAVTAEKITAGAVTTAKLDALAVTADKIATNAITADKIDANAINGKTITGATVRTAATGDRIVLANNDLDFIYLDGAQEVLSKVEPDAYGVKVTTANAIVNVGSGAAVGGTDWSGVSTVNASNGTGDAMIESDVLYARERIVQSGQPIAYRQAAGKVLASASLSQYATANFPITFPAGRFTVPPIVTASCESGRMTIAVQNVTASGCTLQMQNNSNAAGTQAPIYWQATQMASDSAAG